MKLNLNLFNALLKGNKRLIIGFDPDYNKVENENLYRASLEKLNAVVKTALIEAKPLLKRFKKAKVIDKYVNPFIMLRVTQLWEVDPTTPVLNELHDRVRGWNIFNCFEVSERRSDNAPVLKDKELNEDLFSLLEERGEGTALRRWSQIDEMDVVHHIKKMVRTRGHVKKNLVIDEPAMYQSLLKKFGGSLADQLIIAIMAIRINNEIQKNIKNFDPNFVNFVKNREEGEPRF